MEHHENGYWNKTTSDHNKWFMPMEHEFHGNQITN